MSYIIENVSDAARGYHALGLNVVPVRHGTKRPSIRWERWQDERIPEARLQSLFYRAMGIAAVMGPVSRGLGCRDFDGSSGYEAWAYAHKDLADLLPTVKTPRGWHVYFVQNELEGTHNLGDGELRLSHCLTILPPSLHPTGLRYEWTNPLRPDNLIHFNNLAQVGFWTNLVETQEGARGRKRSQEIERGECRQRKEGVVGADSTLIDHETVEKIIRETLPREFHTRHWRIFDLAQSLKSLPQFVEAAATDPGLRAIVRRWHRLALPKITTKEFEETWVDFVTAWPKIRYPKGNNVVVEAFRRAAGSEPPRIALAKYPDNPRLQLLVALCRQLQRGASNHSFFLATRTVAHFFAVEPKRAWKWLYLLESDGILSVVERGGGDGKNARKATAFRYLGDQ